MSGRTVEVALFVGFVAAAATAVVLRSGTKPAPTTAADRIGVLDAAPRNAPFLAIADLERLRKSEFGRALTSSGRELWGLGPIDQVCGTDPTRSMERLALVLPPDTGASLGGRDDLGFIAVGPFEADAIARCAKATIEKRGAEAIVTEIGSFVTIRSTAGQSEGEVAVRTGGPVLFAGSGFLRELVDTADGRVPSARQNQEHGRLRRALGKEAAIVASWSVGRDWLVELLGSRLARMSALSRVRAAAMAVDVAPRVRIDAVLDCGDPEACEDVATLLAWLRKQHLDRLARGVEVSLGDHNVSVRPDGDLVRVSLEISPEEAERALTHALLALATLDEDPSEPARDGGEMPEPDEVIRPSAPSSPSSAPAPR